MWSYIWHTFFFDPVYNSLVFFVDILPGGDVGLAIVCTVVFIKIVMLPLSIKVTKMQAIMRELDPKIKEIKKKISDKQEQAKATMELYKKSNVNPLSSVGLMFIQFPIIISLYLAVSNGAGFPFPDINVDLLYSFVTRPDAPSMLMLGFFDITLKSMPLALLAGATQFLHVRLSMPVPEPKKEGAEPSLKEDFARSMQMQMLYVMPIIIVVIAYTLSAAIALYFTVSNLMAIAQEFVVRRHKD
ncbi:MAG: YidC/Oxa1 family membrane protein insertase [Acidimicrobiales bacterium]|jgi:YidC/Oxa1 family membrane protein insertase